MERNEYSDDIVLENLFSEEIPVVSNWCASVLMVEIEVDDFFVDRVVLHGFRVRRDLPVVQDIDFDEVVLLGFNDENPEIVFE